MKKITTLVALLFLSLCVFGQQEEQYTQFMYYRLGYNPAFAGQDQTTTVSAIVRNQWLGIEGAPQTQLVTFNMPLLNNRVGVGGSITRQTIGVTQYYTVDAAYAYHIRVGNGWLGLGLQGSVRLLRIDFSRVQGTQPIELDGAIPSAGYQSRYVPNFGAGIYYHSKNAYFGISVPRLLESNIDLADNQGVISKEVQHFYAMGGVRIPAGDNIQIQPQVLFKYVSGAPFDGDVNVNLVFMEKFTTGVSYRLGGSKRNSVGESVSLLIGAHLSENITLGLAYDATLTELRSYTNGSVEAMLRYSFGGRENTGNTIVNPRFY